MIVQGFPMEEESCYFARASHQVDFTCDVPHTHKIKADPLTGSGIHYCASQYLSRYKTILTEERSQAKQGLKCLLLFLSLPTKYTSILCSAYT